MLDCLVKSIIALVQFIIVYKFSTNIDKVAGAKNERNT